MTVGVGTVSTSTTAPGGYKLYLSMAGTSNDLRRTGSDVDTISATTGTFTNPVALDIGYWGYAIPSGTEHIATNHFDASYATMESAYPATTKFAAPPASTTTAQLVTSTSAPNTTANEFSVYYGINADDTTPLGNYTGSVLWTALADSADTPSANVSPSSGATIGGETITVTTTLFTTSAVDAHIYMKQGASSTEMTCNRTSYTPLTYTCTTPEKSAGEYEIYVDIPRYEKTYTADFTYFVQPEFFRVSNMQDMTGLICSTATIPNANATHMDTNGLYTGNKDYVPTVTLTDTRGSQPYKTYTVKRLADGKCWMTENLALENATLNSSNSNLPSSKTVNLPASSTSGWCSDYSDACYDKLLVISYADSGSPASSHSEYGNYYNWYTATATYGTRANTGDTSYSICPKGWHLPKGSSSGEFQALYDKYNSSSAMQDTNGPNFVRGGYRGSDANYYVTQEGFYWASTGNSSSINTAYSLTLNESNVFPARDNRAKRDGSSVRCVIDDALNDITYMQDMTNGICEATSIGASKSLIDSRDNKSYTVKKLNDGRCWMTQNLRLVNKAITPADSDLNNTSAFTVTASNSGTWCTIDSSACDDQSMVLDSGNADYGAYYNWYAATAGTGTQGMSSGDATSSICPKGWRLPTGGSSGEFQTLYGKYNTSALMRDANGPNFILAGRRNGSSTDYASTRGYYWSSTASSNNRAYSLYLNSSGVYPTNVDLKYLGYTVRCIADTTDLASEEFFQITTMQEMTNDVCSSVVAPTSSSITAVGTKRSYVAGSTVPTTVLKDARDNNWYTVKKLADGRCWMTDNLKLTGPLTLKPTDSNVNTDWNLPAVNTTFPSSCVNTAYNMSSGNATYGNYYNWYAATAGAGTCSETGDTDTSICPLGWRLPKGGTSDNNEFATLAGKYNASALMRSVYGPAFTLVGNRNAGSSVNQGTNGNYWSSTGYDADYPYILQFNSSEVHSVYLGGKHLGFAVRCVGTN